MVIVLAIAASFTISSSDLISTTNDSNNTDNKQVIEILVGELEMDIAFSEKVGK